jgi:hypothetical protein
MWELYGQWLRESIGISRDAVMRRQLEKATSGVAFS